VAAAAAEEVTLSTHMIKTVNLSGGGGGSS